MHQAVHQAGAMNRLPHPNQNRNSNFKKNQNHNQNREFKCEFCQVFLNSQKQLDQHNSSPKHIMTKNSVSKLLNPPVPGYPPIQSYGGVNQAVKRPKFSNNQNKQGTRIGFRPRVVQGANMIGPRPPAPSQKSNAPTTDNPF